MKYHTTTTLNEIRACSPCHDGWTVLLSHLGKTKADDDPLELLTILDSNGLYDALWCLRAPSLERLSRHFQAWCAERALPLFEREFLDDRRVRAQIEMLRNDYATDVERNAVWVSAWGAALAPEWRVARAARAASEATALEGAWHAARGIAGGAALVPALDAERAAQEQQLRAMIGEKT